MHNDNSEANSMKHEKDKKKVTSKHVENLELSSMTIIKANSMSKLTCISKLWCGRYNLTFIELSSKLKCIQIVKDQYS